MNSNRLMQTSIVITGIVLLVFIYFIRWKGDSGSNWKEIIHGDGKGHYHYLPAAFITKNLGPPAIPGVPREDFLNEFNERLVNRFYCGTAVVVSPFFFAAMGVSKLAGYPVDGYSAPFQCAMSMAALFYFLTGLVFLWKLLRFYSISERSILFTIILIAFGTNILYYVVYEPAMSHVYSFSFIAVFLYYLKKISLEKCSPGDIALALVTIAFITLIRPVNIMILAAAPFIAGDRLRLKSLILDFLGSFKALAAGLFLAGSIISIQLVFFYLQAGEFFVYSYKDARFNFGSPEVINFLFSYRKGLFVYTPLLLFSLAGLAVLYKKSRYQFVWLLLFFCILVYVLSSWSNWYYGDSLGMRPVIDYYAVFAIPLGIALDGIGSRIARAGLGAALILSLFLNMMFCYQYAIYIIHPATMNKEKFWFAFMRTDKSLAGVITGTDDMAYRPLAEEPVASFSKDFEQEPATTTSEAHSGKNVFAFNQATEFGSELRVRDTPGIAPGKEYFVKASVWRYELEQYAADKALLALSLEHADGQNYSLSYFRVNELPRKEFNRWHKTEFNFYLPKMTKADDVIKFYVWNPEKKRFYIDDLEVKVYTFAE
jgi:hypothetical protein